MIFFFKILFKICVISGLLCVVCFDNVWILFVIWMFVDNLMCGDIVGYLGINVLKDKLV